MSIYEKLANIQNELKAPKNQYNDFGGYKYRSCEDILEALKPLLAKNKCTLQIEDRLMNIGERYYIEATAYLYDLENEGSTIITNKACAREEETKKGMDGSQITGASSSYARKYALNGLFLIDDVKDSDATNTGDQEERKVTKKQIELINKLEIDQEKMLEYYNVKSIEELTITQASEIIKAKTGK